MVLPAPAWVQGACVGFRGVNKAEISPFNGVKMPSVAIFRVRKTGSGSIFLGSFLPFTI